MSRLAGLRERRHRHLLLLMGVLALVLLELLLVYTFKRSFTIDVGQPGDTAFVSSFNVDEGDVGYRYRWSTGRSEVNFLGSGSASPMAVTVHAQGPRLPDASPTITMSLFLNGVPLSPGEVTLTDMMLPYTFGFDDPLGSGNVPSPPYVLTISTSTFTAPGDTRTLGAKISSATLLLQSGGTSLPPLDLTVWVLLLAAGFVGLVTPIRGAIGVGLSVLIGILLGIAVYALPHYTAAYLQPIAMVVALGGLLVWQRRHIPRWPRVADIPHTWPRAATWTMLGAMLIFTAVALWALPQVVWIGHADYAENANVARNFVEGRGLTVDYIAQFYTDYPGITHPAETWPLLQPLIIAPFFAVLGATTFAAKLPNLFILLALVWAVFVLASRLWDARVGLIAGLFTLLHPYFFNAVLYPINDLAFTAIFFVLAWLVWRSLDQPAQSTSHIPYNALGIGLLAGLLIWSKPSGATLLLGLLLWAFLVWWRRPRASKFDLPWRALAAVGVAFALVLLPLVARNLLAFGKLFYSTESLDAWILRFYPYHDWEDIYKVYVGAADYPHPRWVVGGKFGYQNLLNAILINFRWVWERGSDMTKSDFIIAPVPFLGAVVGFVALSRRVAGLFIMVAISIAIYGLFVLFYWHFEGRYFQVAIPWLYMLLAWAIVWLWDRVRAVLPDATWRRASFVALPLVTLAFLLPSLVELQNYLKFDTRPTSFTVAMDWLSQNSTPDDVVMTRDPWELNWHSRRKAVMIPNDDLATIRRIADQYGVTMLQLGGPADGININACPPDGSASSGYPTGTRKALGKLYCGYEMPGFQRVYQNGDLTIYRLTR
ncbi:MAG: glycosyltransferase family 39 protein [Chloroflexota bacterium]